MASKRTGTHHGLPSSKKLKIRDETNLNLVFRKHKSNPSQKFLIDKELPGYQVNTTGSQPSGLYLKKFNTHKDHILAPVSCQMSLSDYLKGINTLQDVPGYPIHTIPTKWSPSRPNSLASNIIRGMCSKVFDLHKKGEFHGALHHIENYGIEEVENHANCSFPNKGVILLHNNTKREDRRGHEKKPIVDVREGQKEDIYGLRLIIKKYVLKGEPETNLAPDVKDLLKILDKPSSLSLVRSQVSVHSSLWESRSRFYFYGDVWNMYDKGNWEVKGKIEKILQNVSCVTSVNGWKSHIPQSGPISKIFGRNSYNDRGTGLLRFCRIAFAHIENMGRSYNIDPPYIQYSDMEYFELKMLKTFPMLVEDLNKGLCQEGLYL